MRGKIIKKSNLWYIKSEMMDVELHPDDASKIFELSKIFDNIEARIFLNPEVDFEIIDNYAKLKQNT